jgi:hypothetical protein
MQTSTTQSPAKSSLRGEPAWKIKLIEAGNPNWDELDPTAC